ncbi:hypothetical protein [Thiohalorhabdus sp.]|uniref:hypothetical protein n=1 Tax=Thiohalorhabdus sp. TaxID=3094134 RepID=UPI002FC2E4C7
MRTPTLVLSLTLALAASSAAQAQGWSLLPVTDADYRAEPTLAALGGMQDPDVDGVSSGGAYGVELSLNCPTLATPRHGIRQQISLTRFDNDGLELTSLEINPHYVMPIGQGLGFGFGPGLSYVAADGGGDSDGVFGLQAGVSLHYRQGPLFLGAEARYQWTQDADLGGGDTDLANSRLMGKAGVTF